MYRHQLLVSLRLCYYPDSSALHTVWDTRFIRAPPPERGSKCLCVYWWSWYVCSIYFIIG